MVAYKLVKQRKDGTYGPLFIGRRTVYRVGEWHHAEAIRTTGYAYRPGFHCLAKPHAPHLRMSGNRVWLKVEIHGFEIYDRPEHQGGRWFLAQHMKILGVDKKSNL